MKIDGRFLLFPVVLIALAGCSETAGNGKDVGPAMQIAELDGTPSCKTLVYDRKVIQPQMKGELNYFAYGSGCPEEYKGLKPYPVASITANGTNAKVVSVPRKSGTSTKITVIRRNVNNKYPFIFRYE